MQTEQLIYSEYGDDPDLGELVEMFVEELPNRVSTLQTHAQDQDWESLRRVAHQMKGSGGSYGFGDISTYAARLEASCKQESKEQQILETLEELISLCSRIRAGTED